MKNKLALLIGVFTITSIIRSSAQTIAELSNLKAPVSAITVDANLKDWGDSLQYYSSDAGLRYAFTNDKDNIYFAIKLDDLAEAMRALKAGVTLGIDPKGKKKPNYSITFPLNTQPGTVNKPLQSNSLNGITQADRDELHRELMTSLRGINVEGFKDIEGDMITTSNTYGIKVAVDYDAKGNLICEAAIPLKFFNADAKSKTEWSFDVKLNGITNPPAAGGNDGKVTGGLGSSGNRGGYGGGGMGGSGRGGMGGGRGGRGGMNNSQRQQTDNNDERSGLNKPVEFAGKFYPAPIQ